MRLTYAEGDPQDLTLLEENARYMTREQFARLVENVRRDGALTSAPLVWYDREGERRVVLSGNHRVSASIQAGLTLIGWLETDEKLSRQQQVAIQLSHNAIVGQDDPLKLRELYDQLADVDWRAYSGLDDATLKLLGPGGDGSFGEANLDYATISLVFLPGELSAARAAFDAARKAAGADGYLLAAASQYEATLDALASVHAAYKVGNVATALSIILAVFERHLGELADGWFDGTDARHSGGVPVEVLMGVRQVKAAQAGVIQQAVERMIRDGDASTPVRALELICADYLGA